MKNTDYVNRLKSLDDAFKNAHEDLFKDLTDFVLPGYGSYLDRGKPFEVANVKRHSSIINPTATRSARICGAGMVGGLCSPSRRWFRLKMQDKDMNKHGPIKEWLHASEQVLYDVFDGSNFYTEMHRCFEMQTGFGTSPMYIFEDPEKTVYFETANPGEYRLALGAKQEIDTIYRHKWMSAKSMRDNFGESNLSDTVKNHLKDATNNPYEHFEVVHVIEPRRDRDAEKMDGKNKPYASIWFQHGAQEDEFLRISGFDEKPFVSPRWHLVGASPYGQGPGHDAVGMVKMIQEMEKDIVKGLHREINPPLDVPSQYKNVISLLPGAVNYRDPAAGKDKIGPILNVRLNVEGVQNKIKEIEYHIKQAFFNDLFMLIIESERAGTPVTATEILRKHEEKMVVLGPTVHRQIVESLDPSINRVYNICAKEGLLPPPPPDIVDEKWEVDYVSVLAQAQRMTDAQGMVTYREEATQVAQVDPGSIVKTNWDKHLEEFGDIIGVPPDIVRTEEEANSMREAQAAAAQKQAEMEQAQAMGGVARDLGSANTGGDSALGQLISNMDQGGF